jgi:hypothetical protein
MAIDRRMCRLTLGVLCWFVLLFILGFWWAWAAAAHDIYTSIYNRSGVNCCMGQDCAPIDERDIKPISNGYLIKQSGEVVRIPQTAISPDDRWHVCRFALGDIRCLMIPDNGS